MPMPVLSPAQITDIGRDGYVTVRALFDAGETNIFRTAAKADAALKSNAYEIADGQKRVVQRREKVGGQWAAGGARKAQDF